MNRAPDVLVIGGGVIGLTTAYFLARDGHSVRLLDRSTPGTEASWAGAGIIPPGNVSRAVTSYDRLRAASSFAFAEASADLRDRTGIDNGYRVCGGVELFEGDSADPTTSLWEAEGIPFERLDDRSLKQVEPGLGWSDASAYFLPDMAQVRNPWHLRALVAACRAVGVEIESYAAVTSFRTDESRVFSALDDRGRSHSADRFLIAAGAWADGLLLHLGACPGIHPVLGQIVLFHPSGRILGRIVSVDKRYLVPREDGRVLVGATEEPEAGYEKRNTVEGVQGLIDFARDLIPDLAGAAVEKTWSGLRPGSPDGLPVLGPVPGWENAFVAGGHYRAGIQLSISTASVMADLLTGRSPSIPLDDFRLDRPPAPPFAAAFRS